MIRVKTGVRLAALQPPLIDAVQRAAEIFSASGYDEMWVTSTDEGKHGFASLHYVGLAVDIGTKNRGIDRDEARLLTDRIRRSLGEGYDVIAEDTHIHVEYQPKTGEKRWALEPI